MYVIVCVIIVSYVDTQPFFSNMDYVDLDQVLDQFEAEEGAEVFFSICFTFLAFLSLQ